MQIIKDADFKFPTGMVLRKDGILVVADTGNHLVKLVKDGCVQRIIGGGVLCFVFYCTL